MILYDRYSKWNDAIIDYATQGLNTGERVFLSIDDDALEIIGATFNEPAPPTWLGPRFHPVRPWAVHPCRSECMLDSALALTIQRIVQFYVDFLGFHGSRRIPYMGDQQGDRPHRS